MAASILYLMYKCIQTLTLVKKVGKINQKYKVFLKICKIFLTTSEALKFMERPENIWKYFEKYFWDHPKVT